MTAGMRTRGRKRNKGKAEKLVPPVWEATKVVEKLQYRACSEQETLGTEAWPGGGAPHYKAAEEEGPVAWSREAAIPDLEIGHATLEEVQFEWGRSNRAVRHQPDVRGQEAAAAPPPPALLRAMECRAEAEVWERAEELAAPAHQAAALLRAGQNPALRVAGLTAVSTEECEEEVKGAKNTKYFCRTCDANICNSCFSLSCLAHKVQWIPYCSTFACLSAHHV